MNKLFLIDANGLLYRAFFALPAMSSDKGIPTNAVYGFTVILLKILKEYNPKYIAVAYDMKGPTFRHEMFQQYKIERPPMPDNLVPQIELSKKICNALGIATLELEKFEADDLISYLAIKAAQENMEAVIVTSDKDLFQLVNDKIKILHPKNYEFYDSNKIFEKVGVLPSQIPDFLALVGDKSDCIPGLPGIGEKTAANLLSKYKSLENIYNNLDEITPPKIKTSLEISKDIAFLGKKLATLKASLPINIELKNLELKNISKNELINIFNKLKFSSLISKIADSDSNLKINYKIISHSSELSNVIGKLLNETNLSIQILTEQNNFNITIVGMALCSNENISYYLPFSHNYIGQPQQLDLDISMIILKPLLESHKIAKFVHDFKLLNKILSSYKIKINGQISDLLLLAYLINPTKHNYSLEELAKEYLTHTAKTIKEIAKINSKKIPTSSIEINKAANFLCEQTQLLLKLHPIIVDKCKENQLIDLYKNIELPLTYVLADMELKGVKINPEVLKNLSSELSVKLTALSNEIYDYAGEIFNINSPQQVSHILFKKLKLPPSRKTKITKMLSTGIEVLEELAQEEKLAKLLLEYRQLFKLKSTYLDTLPQMINPTTNRIHSIFNQASTATGRLSSSNPNLQNIPTRTLLGKRIREAFIADKNNMLISADYSQIELRILAHFSSDENLIAAFQNNIDIHSLTASKIFGVPQNDVSTELRSKAKAINFGIIYGLSAYGLSRQIGCTPEEAQLTIDSYFHKHPKVYTYIMSTLQSAASKGYVETLFGRKRFISGIEKIKKTATTPIQRAAINMPIQGTAADIIKLAMINLHQELIKQNLQTKIILQIHDELLLEAPTNEIELVKKLTKRIMETSTALKVPLKVEIGIGATWSDAH